MKETMRRKVKSVSSGEMLREYRFDYAKAKPNRFADAPSDTPSSGLKSGGIAAVTIQLDPDVARVFRNAETVNAVLRALLTTMPSRPRPSTVPLQRKSK